MIIYSKNPIPMQITNMLVLEDDVDGGFVYVNKDTYDQALEIKARFDGDGSALWKHMSGTFTKETNPDLYSVIVKWRKTTPEPLNMLMFAFVSLNDTKGINWTEVTKEDMYGFMHELSLMLDFNAMTLVPAEVRSKTKVPSSILRSYKTSWDGIIGGLRNKVILDETPKKPATVVDMTPVDFEERMERVMSKFANTIAEALKEINISAPAPIIQPTVVPTAVPEIIPTPQPTVVVQPVVSQPSPVPQPSVATHIKTSIAKSEEEMNDDEKKDADVWNQDWGAIFAEAEASANAKVNSPAKAATKKEEEVVNTEKDSINGTPVATYNEDKAKETIQAIHNFDADF